MDEGFHLAGEEEEGLTEGSTLDISKEEAVLPESELGRLIEIEAERRRKLEDLSGGFHRKKGNSFLAAGEPQIRARQMKWPVGSPTWPPAKSHR